MAAHDSEFRAEVRAFLDGELPRDQRFVHHRLEMMTKDAALGWQRKLAKRGWSVPHWPVEHGGTDWSAAERAIFTDEMAAAGPPLTSGFGPNMIGPILIACGTDEQRKQHLPPIVAGERLWCQGYSEPGSGSDLASLRTRARLDGDDYVVDGQKLWTTHAHWADWMFCLVRTDSSGRPQQGITFLLIDMRTPGIEVRPLRSIDGLHHLNEVFFTGVRVPVANRIGGEGDGWQIAKQLLGHERQSIARVAASRVDLEQIKDMLTRDPEGDDPEIAARLESLEHRLIGIAALETALASGVGHPDRGAAALKLLGSELQQDIAELGVRVAGIAALPMPDGSGEPVSVNGIGGERATANFMFSRSHSIYGGTSEVQRTIVSKTLHA